jgi:hypothetical protein
LIDIVVAWHQDRLHRQMHEGLVFNDLARKHDVRVVTVMGGEDNLSTARGRFNSNNATNVAAYESEHRSERVKAGLADRAAAGKIHTGGWQPYGWRKDRKMLNKREAEVVREMIMRVIDGDSLSAITRDLNDRKIKTASGVRWSHRRVRETVMRHRNAGLYCHKGEVVATGQWEPIVTPAEFWQARAILEAPERRSHLGNRGKAHLLSGLATCGRCGAKIIASKGRRYKDKPGPNTYRCSEHAHLGRLEAPIDRYVTEKILSKLGVLVSEREEDDQATIAARRVEKLQEQLKQAAAAFSADILTMEQLGVINSELRPHLKQAMADVAKAGQPSVLRRFYGPGDTRQMWEGLTLAERRRVVSRFDITINSTSHKGPGFDADAIKISWKTSAGNQTELTRSSALLVQHAAHTEFGAWVLVDQ